MFIATLIHIHQFRRIGVFDQKFAIEQRLLDQLMTQRHEQCAVSARANRHPLVCNRGIARAHRIDGNKLATVAFEFRKLDF